MSLDILIHDDGTSQFSCGEHGELFGPIFSSVREASEFRSFAEARGFDLLEFYGFPEGDAAIQSLRDLRDHLLRMEPDGDHERKWRIEAAL